MDPGEAPLGSKLLERHKGEFVIFYKKNIAGREFEYAQHLIADKGFIIVLAIKQNHNPPLSGTRYMSCKAAIKHSCNNVNPITAAYCINAPRQIVQSKIRGGAYKTLLS